MHVPLLMVIVLVSGCSGFSEVGDAGGPGDGATRYGATEDGSAEDGSADVGMTENVTGEIGA